MIRFTVYGPFKAKQSARMFVGKDGKPHSFRDPAVTKWQDRVRAAAIPVRPNKPISGPVRMNIIFYFALPQNKVRKDKNKQPFYNSSRPDFDNLCKGVSDALNKLIWNDDGQVAWVEFRKCYTEETERVNIEVIELTV